MDASTERYRRKKRRAVWTAVILSLLVHGALVAVVLDKLLEAAREAKKEERELVFIDEPPPPPPPVVAVAPPAPEPARPTPSKLPPKAPPAAAQPSLTAQDQPQLGSPDAPISEGPIATSPNPSPQTEGPRAVSPDQIRTGLTWNVFEKTFEATAAAARQAYEAQSMEKRRGGMRFGSLTGKVKAAMQNNRSWVAQGNPEQLSPAEVRTFRAYLESTHDKIHSLFADGFLASLTSLDPSDPLNNMDLVTMMEFEILANGTINEVHVLRTSGVAVFDAAAVDSLYRSSPFLAPPKEILSWNNRAYFRWGFYRNQRKCGVFNAEPYRLRAPDAAPEAIPENTRIFSDG